MDPALPSAKSAQSPDERQKLRRVIAERGLCGLANDTKWNEFIGAMRAQTNWRPSYRFKSVACPPSGWDCEWFYHLPFPFICIEWLDLAFLEERREPRLPPRLHTTDHSPWIEEILRSIGLEYTKGVAQIRIFGYSPKNLELFDQ